MTATKNAPKTPAHTQAPQKVTLADLELTIAKTIIASDTTEVSAAVIAKHGDPVVAAGGLSGYTADRYSDGRWVSKGVVARVTALVASQLVTRD